MPKIQNVVIVIGCMNEAFKDNETGEVSRILTNLSARFHMGQLPDSTKDANGNVVCNLVYNVPVSDIMRLTK